MVRNNQVYSPQGRERKYVHTTKAKDFDDLYVIWRVDVQGRAFWGLDEIAPHLGGQIHKNTNFGGVNRRFQA